MRSLHSLVASPVPSPPAADVAEQVGRFEERTSTRVSPGPVLAHDSQPEDVPPAADTVKQAGWSKGWTGARAWHDS